MFSRKIAYGFFWVPHYLGDRISSKVWYPAFYGYNERKIEMALVRSADEG